MAYGNLQFEARFFSPIARFIKEDCKLAMTATCGR